MELSITLICLGGKKIEDMPFAEFALEDLSLPGRVYTNRLQCAT